MPYISHETLLGVTTFLFTITFTAVGYLYKRLDTIKKDITQAVPTHDQVAQLTKSLTDISVRLDALYTILARNALTRAGDRSGS